MLIYKNLDDFSYFFTKTELELIRLYTHTCTFFGFGGQAVLTLCL